MTLNPVSASLATNLERAVAGWGTDMPAWVRLLATACDATNQRIAGERLDASSAYVSRLINNRYPGDMREAEMKVRRVFGGEDVHCPIYGAIPLSSCIRARRRKTPPRNPAHHEHDRACPACPNNSDGGRP
ncbi:hypothetical protein [Sphingobium aquiterrae]|uniref:hypothetical protein n=1 Tax=Sphingobium aquiterrae TaxID=2038656 RepID=UPI0030166880